VDANSDIADEQSALRSQRDGRRGDREGERRGDGRAVAEVEVDEFCSLWVGAGWGLGGLFGAPEMKGDIMSMARAALIRDESRMSGGRVRRREKRRFEGEPRGTLGDFTLLVLPGRLVPSASTVENLAVTVRALQDADNSSSLGESM